MDKPAAPADEQLNLPIAQLRRGLTAMLTTFQLEPDFCIFDVSLDDKLRHPTAVLKFVVRHQILDDEELANEVSVLARETGFHFDFEEDDGKQVYIFKSL